MTEIPELVKILSNYAGETGRNEGAVEVLNRKLEEIKALKDDLSAMKQSFALANNWRNAHLDDSKKLEKIKEWKKEVENYQYGDGLDTQSLLEKLKEIL